jgi:hypothetical protein
MNSKLWIRKALTLCLVVAVYATYSMVALAGTERIAGELTVTGSGMNGESPFVTVNGEVAKSGRSIFSSSTIATPVGASALLNFGKSGIIELAPNSAIIISFDDKSISGDLTSGKVSVLGSSGFVTIRTLDGQLVKLSAGESVSASGLPQTDDDDDAGGLAWWGWALIFGGAAAAILIAATTDNNRVALGGTATTVSPNR